MIKAATLVETIVALLIVMISFSAGMMIYNSVISGGINDAQLNALGQAEYLADSLVGTSERAPGHFTRSGIDCGVTYETNSKHDGLLTMRVVCKDAQGKTMAEQIRLIKSQDHD